MKTMHLVMKLTVTLAVVGLAGNTRGASITVGATAPATDVIIQQLANETWDDIRWTANSTAGWKELRQTFTAPSNFTLDKISYLVEQDNPFPTAGLTMRVDVLSTTNVDTPTGTSLLGPENGVTPSFSLDTKTWMTLDVANVALTSGNVYVLVFGFDSLNTSIPHRLGNGDDTTGGVWYDTNDPYTGGKAFRFLNGANSTASGWTLTSGRDLAFVIQGFETVGGVPEPSSVFLLAIGGLLVWRRVRK